MSARRLSNSSCNPPAYMEKVFWHEMVNGQKGTVEYGVNVDGSAFSCDPNDQLGKSKWNLKVSLSLILNICMIKF